MVSRTILSGEEGEGWIGVSLFQTVVGERPRRINRYPTITLFCLSTRCCQSEANDGVADAHVDAKPILDPRAALPVCHVRPHNMHSDAVQSQESTMPAVPFISGGDTEQAVEQRSQGRAEAAALFRLGTGL